MRILVLATRYFGPGGVEAYTRAATRALVDSGREVGVLALLGGAAPEAAPCPGRYLGHSGDRPTAWVKARFSGEAMRRGGHYDLVVCTHVAVAPLAAVLHRTLHIPYVVVAHGIEVWGELARRRQRALARAARVATVSRFTANRLTEFQGIVHERVHVVHPCVDPALLDLAGPDAPYPAREGVTLLTVTRLSARERYKGCETVIRALPAVATLARSHAIRYIIAGDGDDRPRLEALARETGTGAAVSFVGPVDQRRLGALYRSCDVFVMPSVIECRPDGWVGEGFGIVYIEAAAFGRPVVAGNSGGAPEAVRHGITGFVVEGEDIDAVTGALARLAEDPALRARMGEAGREWVSRHFTFERFRRDVDALIAAAAERAR